MVKRVKTEEKVKKEADKKKPQKEDKDNSVKIFFGICAAIIIVLIVLLILRDSSNKFTYMGVQFVKENDNGIDFYAAKIPVYDSYGAINNYLTIKFRKDPRVIKDIEVNTSEGIRFVRDKKTYVTYGPSPSCKYVNVAGANLGLFLYYFGIDYKAALDDPSYANSTNIPYVNCDTHPDNTVLYITNGTETKIEQTGQNCYKLTFKDCEILEVTERFQLALLENYIEGLAN